MKIKSVTFRVMALCSFVCGYQSFLDEPTTVVYPTYFKGLPNLFYKAAANIFLYIKSLPLPDITLASVLHLFFGGPFRNVKWGCHFILLHSPFKVLKNNGYIIVLYLFFSTK
jgi:hypothetical protein